MFNLEQGIGQWKKGLAEGGLEDPELLAELESHLREDIEQRIGLGLSEQQAFETAVQQMGQADLLKLEFKKIRNVKRVLQQTIVWILIVIAFLSCWIAFGRSPAMMLIYAVLLTGLIFATFIDFAHFIIPDAITIGGIFAGLGCSVLLPQLHGQIYFLASMWQSLLGIGVGAGLLYGIVRLGKLAFGQQRVMLGAGATIIFTESGLLLPDKAIRYDDLFYRKLDAVTLQAGTVRLGDRSYQDVPVRLTRSSLRIGNDEFDPKEVASLEATGAEIVLPREAMGLGDVKLMAAIGAFLGWQAVIFSLILSSLIGSLVGCGLIGARRGEWSARLPYGPYLAVAAIVWVFGGKHLLSAVFAG